jgi:hypothetical protein
MEVWMKIRILLPALLLSAALVSPASANWFHNPYQNIYRNVGSAPNPTPQDIRENRLPIVVQEEDNDHPILSAIRSMFSGRNQQSAQAQPQTGQARNVPASSPSR